jgi:hypothetical protein
MPNGRGEQSPLFAPNEEIRMTNIDLLSRVQSADGWYVILGLNNGRYADQQIVATREEFDELTNKYVANQWDVYFGVAKYAEKKPKEFRKKENVLNLKALWIDLDCGPTKAVVNQKTGRPDGYIDQQTALQELQRFCKTIGLPKPLIVSSGRGIHVYWPLTAPLERSEWEPFASRLNELCLTHNLYVDSSVFEAARVLRVPGTYNFKDVPAKPVEVVSDAPDYDAQTLKDILGVKEVVVQPKRELSELQKAMMANTVSRFSKIMVRSANGDGCAQLLYQYNNQESVSEPMWFNALSVAQHCIDRDTAIHKISEKYEGYDYDDTEKKALHTQFPQTCATFEKNNPGGCEGCPWKGRIKSPIVLGKEVVRAEEDEDFIVEEAPDVQVTDNEEEAETVTYTVPKFPHPYFRGKNGGVYVTPPGEDEAEPICVYEHDLYVVKRMRDPDPEIGETVLMRLHLPRDGVRDFVIPLADVGSKDKLRETLAANGVAGYKKQTELLGNFVMAFIKEMQYKKKAEVMRKQFGWADKNSKFILGDREISVDGVFHSPPSHATKQIADYIVPMGNMDKWKEVFNLYGQPGLEPHAFAALTAFGAPLLMLTGHKGAIINVIHKDSGTGKSTALYMCNSVYGHPDKLTAIWKDTHAAKMIRLGLMNNLPFTIDEITNLKPEEFSNLAYSMSQGRGADRSKSQTNELRVNDQTWQTISLCSSNASFYEKLGVHKSTPDGEMMRLLEYKIESNNIIPPAVAKQMFDYQLKENYGHAGEIYIRYVLNNLEEVKSSLIAIQQKIDAEMHLTNRERFWSAVISCNITGGLIAKNLKLHDYDMRTIYLWATQQMLKGIREDVAAPASNSASVIGDFINRHIQNMLIVDDEVDKRTNMHNLPKQEPKGDLVIRYEPDTKKLFIGAKAFRTDCVETQTSYKDTLHDLKTKGIYVGAGNKRMSKGMKIVSPGVHALEFDCSVPDFINVDALIPVQDENTGD